MIYYSLSTGGFYDDEIHGENRPDDCIEIERDYYTALFDAQSQGATLTVDEAGKPVAKFPPPPTFEESKIKKKVAVAIYRYEKEINGLLINDVSIKTDRESQSQLNSALTSLQSGLITDTPWKAENGWMLVTLAEIQPIAQAVAMHVRSCFVQEKVHSDLIDAITSQSALDAYDITTGWPE